MTTTIGPVLGVVLAHPPVYQITISWPAVAKAVSYQTQYRKRGIKAWTNGPLVKAPATATNINSLPPGMTYDFQVIALGA